jgi:hypothetical protein
VKLEEYSRKYDLVSKTEIDKVAYLAFYHLKIQSHDSFTISDINDWFTKLHYSIPNSSRLRKKIRASSIFIRGITPDSISLHARQIKKFDLEILDLSKITREVISDGSILPDTLLEYKRAYIQKFGKQINASYSKNIFDGCAVLMRRMVEICLIHTYENLGIESQIKSGPDKYKDLKEIIKDARTNTDINLTSKSKACLDEFRILGNLSAHQLYYNCKIEEINNVKLNFRILIEELFNKSGKKVEK